MYYVFFLLVPEVPERFFRKYNYAFLDDFRLLNAERFTAEDIAEYKQAIAKPGALTAGLNYYRALLPPEVLVGEVSLLTEKVSCPTLLIVGENSPTASPSAAEWSREFVEAPFTLRLVPNAGHWVQNEQPELVNQYILEFLADLKY